MADVVRLPLASELQPRDAILLSNGLGSYDWGGNEMKNIAAPTLDQSAATKKYVDDSVGAIVVTAGLPLDPLFTVVRAKKIQLNGEAVTPVLFKSNVAAYYQAAGGVGPYTGLANADTIIMTVEGAARTITLAAVAAKHESGATPSTDISGSVDTNFKIAVDADAIAGTYRDVTIAPAGLATGADIASELEDKIQALGGIYAGVTVAYGSGIYTITSSKKGTGSRVLIAAGDTDDISTELKIGTLGTSTSGTGNVADIASVTAAEIIAIGMTGIVITVNTTGLKFTSAVAGRTSKMLSGNGTGNTPLGITNGVTSYGAQGMGYTKDMLDADYLVVATLNGEATIAGKGLSINNRTALGFEILCETTASTANIDLVVLGQPAV